MFKFKNWEDYKNQRDAALEVADQMLTEGNMEEYNKQVELIKEMDDAYEKFANEQANLSAMKSAAHVPAAMTGEASVVAAGGERDYRMQFMNYVLKGTPIKMSNADQVTVTSDVGAVIPNTILNRIVEKMESVGGIYAKMTKTFFQGGVTVPTSAAKPVATWTTERGTSDKQKKSTGSVTFTYHKLRCVVAVSIAVDTVTLDVFESVVSNNIADAMIKAIESAAFNGTGANQPKGILVEDIPAGHSVDITEGQDPTYKNLMEAEGALPEEYDASAEWYMKKSTFFTKFLGMTDKDGQPIGRISTGIDRKPEYNLLGRKVNFTEHVPAFAASVTADTPFAVMFDFADYMLNTNMAITVKEYDDNETDDKIKKAIMLADGKAISLESLVVMQVKNS